jgi:hypothetical protein
LRLTLDRAGDGAEGQARLKVIRNLWTFSPQVRAWEISSIRRFVQRSNRQGLPILKTWQFTALDHSPDH